MINVKLFAQYREMLGSSLDLPASIGSVAELKQAIQTLYPKLQDEELLVAVNHTIADKTTKITEKDEVAVFPPVTGG